MTEVIRIVERTGSRALAKKHEKPPIYQKSEYDGLRKAGRFNAQLMDFIRPSIREGITTNELDKLAYDYTLDHGHIPACLGYPGQNGPYPKSVCTSINEVVCHGVPDDRPLLEGDILNIDLTTIVDGWHGDQSEMFLIGEVSSKAKRLVQVTFDSLFRGIHAIKPNGKVIDIGRAIYEFALEHRVSVVQEYQGHGIGREFHQEPEVPHFPVRRFSREVILPGMCFTIEPMLNIGTWKTEQDDPDGWTVRTKDGSLSAQFEHTILMTEEGPEILTLTRQGPQEGHTF
ncbi:MAG: type I methionyl aminopeptidase [Planctomycetes bacterium]|nr:type I methionyl aminopeptidase [Planctomycetota bacterium]